MSEPIRVLHVIGIMDRGGAESMIMNLYRNIDREKVQFDFVENSFASAAYDDEILSLGGKIYRCPHFIGKNYIQYRRWWEKFFQDHDSEYHIIHGHIGSCATIYLHIAKMHGLYTIAHSHNTFQTIYYKLAAYGTRFIADYFFGCSEEAIYDRYGERIAKSNRCRVLQNAIDTSKFTFNELVREEVRKELHYTPSDFVIGQVGRFMPEKNHEFTVNLYSKVCKQNPNAKLLLVGEGPLREKIEASVIETGLEDGCIFTGSRPDVNRLMQAIDVLVMPSVYEGLPVTLIEAQATGLPCVVSDTVTKDADITGLITYLPLNSVELWEQQILQTHQDRKDTSATIVAAGYDIQTTAKWLQTFYMKIPRRSGKRNS